MSEYIKARKNLIDAKYCIDKAILEIEEEYCFCNRFTGAICKRCETIKDFKNIKADLKKSLISLECEKE